MIQDLAQLVGLMRGRNPQEVAMSLLQNSQINDPNININQLVNYAQKGDVNSLVSLATNLFAQRGMDFNQTMNSFMSMMK